MTTNELIIRKASNVLYKNEIADFSSLYFSPSEGISAISIENNKWTELLENRYELLSYSCHKINSQITSIRVMMYLSDQPNTKMIKYKGGWGLLKSQIDIDKIKDRKEIVFEKDGKLDFILEGVINIHDDYVIKKILSDMNIVYFSIGGEDISKIEKYDDWINYMLDSGGMVMFFLGLGIEPACELVIMKKSEDIFELFLF
ncbi:hypothetical protein [Bibersteinia trehalosi]|uniref:hypothetical protein n=1 Tax=Bibersteinia trehalosi TaxID=47735 RepID=UPI0040457AB5